MFSSTYLITVAQEHKGVWGVNTVTVFLEIGIGMILTTLGQ